MKTQSRSSFGLMAFALISTLSANAQTLPPQPALPIPLTQLGAVTGQPNQASGASITATPGGAQLRCTFQRLEGQVASDGLCLQSTAVDAAGGRFQVKAALVTRSTEVATKSIPFWESPS